MPFPTPITSLGANAVRGFFEKLVALFDHTIQASRELIRLNRKFPRMKSIRKHLH